MDSTMNFSATKGDLKIEINRLEFTMLLCDSASEGMTVSLFTYNLVSRAKVKVSPKVFAASCCRESIPATARYTRRMLSCLGQKCCSEPIKLHYSHVPQWRGN